MTSVQNLNDPFKHIKHVGSRPKDDKDNYCREELCKLVRGSGRFYELSAEKLYLVHLAMDESSKSFCERSMSPNCPFIFWTFDDHPNMTYEPFNMDFGPLNLATTHQFCSQLKVWFDTLPSRDPDSCVVVVLDDLDLKQRLNATVLVAVAAMVLLGMSDVEVLQKLKFYMMYKREVGETQKALVFREKKKFSDVSGNESLICLIVEDCVRSFYAAIQNKFYDYYEFDHAEYLFYETVMSGDLNWIIPGKLLAFAGPSDRPVQSRIYHKHPPQFYHQYFRDNNVTTIVRLNEAEYESSGFSDHGFDHHDLIFPDGYPPTSTIAAKFIKIVDEAKGGVAVHCYAGIGRTGTLIAAYLMARYDFTPQMAIAWTRICRPGSVIGEQQDWLFAKFDRSTVNKSSLKLHANRKHVKPANSQKIELKVDPSTKMTYAAAEVALGQARALVLTKKQRDNSDRPCTRQASLMKSIEEPSCSRKSQTKKVDLVIDLGKTIPLMLRLADLKDLKEGENPSFYRIRDGKYEWKVKFPERGYVELKHDRQKDLEALAASPEPKKFEQIFREPVLDFRYEQTLGSDDTESNGLGSSMVPKKPVVYYSISWVRIHNV